MILLNLRLASAIRGAAAGVALEESHHLLCLPKMLRRKPECMHSRRKKKKSILPSKSRAL